MDTAATLTLFATLMAAVSAQAAPVAPPAASAARPADPPLYFSRALTEADVAGRPLRELAILRNTIFARAGQPFRKQWLHDYFAALPWYRAKTIVDPRSLSPIDQQNADFLSRYEIALPRAELERRLQLIQDRHRYAAPGEPLAIAFAPGNQRALLASSGGIRLVDLPAGRPSASWGGSVKTVGLAPDGRHAAALTSADHLDTVELTAGVTGKALSSIKPPDRFHRAGVFSADGRRFLGGPAFETVETGPDATDEELADGSFVVADTATGTILFKHETKDAAPCLALAADGERALVDDLGAVSLWDPEIGKALWTRKLPGGDREAGRCAIAAISPGGALAVTAAPAGAAILDLRTGQVLRTLALPPAIGALAFSPRGDQLLVGIGGAAAPEGGKSSSLELWDVKSGQRLRALPAGGAIAAVAWSADGARALSFGVRGPALWDVAAGRALPAFAGHEAWWNRDEQIEAVLLSRALGRPLQMFSQLDFERTPFDAPALLDELVPLAQLTGMSRRDLRLLRNMVYARRGRRFRSPILRDYFEKLDWYRADPAYSDARLTAVDRRNIKLIQSTEVELGGPLNDRQHKEEDVPEA